MGTKDVVEKYRKLGLSLLAVTMAAVATAQESLSNYYQVVEAKDSTKGAGSPIKAVEINSKLQIVWDEFGLFQYLSSKVKVNAPKGEEAADKIKAMGEASSLLQKAQELQLEAAAAGFELAFSEKGQKGGLQAAYAEKISSIQDFRGNQKVQLLGTKGPAEAMYVDLASAIAGTDNEGFAPLLVSANSIANNVSKLLNDKVAQAPKAHMRMSAFLVTSAGKPHQVHLDGYDKLTEGDPTPFNRYKFVVDSRTLEELQAAQSVLDAIRQYRSTRLTEYGPKIQNSLRSAFEKFGNRCNFEFLKVSCDTLVHDLSVLPQEECGPIIKDIRMLQALLSPLEKSKIASAKSEFLGLQLLAQLLNGLSTDLFKFVNEAHTLVPRILTGIKQVTERSPNVVKKALVDQLEAISSDFVSNFDDIKEEADTFAAATNKAKDGLMLTEDFSLVEKELIAKNLGPDEELDTSLELQRIPVARRPGDKLVIKVTVAQEGTSEGEEVILAEDTQNLYIEAYGGYAVSSGALLFVDPKGTIPRKLSFEPTVGLGFHYHYGIRGNNYWNRTLNPGFGASFMLLDFKDQDRFELGTGLGLTLFNESVWLGYGRNWNAKSDFIYLGINPYVLTNVLRRR